MYVWVGVCVGGGASIMNFLRLGRGAVWFLSSPLLAPLPHPYPLLSLPCHSAAVKEISHIFGFCLCTVEVVCVWGEGGVA